MDREAGAAAGGVGGLARRRRGRGPAGARWPGRARRRRRRAPCRRGRAARTRAGGPRRRSRGRRRRPRRAGPLTRSSTRACARGGARCRAGSSARAAARPGRRRARTGPLVTTSTGSRRARPSPPRGARSPRGRPARRRAPRARTRRARTRTGRRRAGRGGRPCPGRASSESLVADAALDRLQRAAQREQRRAQVVGDRGDEEAPVALGGRRGAECAARARPPCRCIASPTCATSRARVATGAIVELAAGDPVRVGGQPRQRRSTQRRRRPPRRRARRRARSPRRRARSPSAPPSSRGRTNRRGAEPGPIGPLRGTAGDLLLRVGRSPKGARAPG